MQYAKPVLSIADSVVRLKNKGLLIANDEDAERFLRAVGYFRFRGYALPFMQQAPVGFLYGNRQFKPGTTFDDIRQIYEFDRALRSLVMEQIDRIEVAVRTAILQELNTPLRYALVSRFYEGRVQECIRSGEMVWRSSQGSAAG
jgi:abortive infection bacteriophage resistance protein